MTQEELCCTHDTIQEIESFTIQESGYAVEVSLDRCMWGCQQLLVHVFINSKLVHRYVLAELEEKV